MSAHEIVVLGGLLGAVVAVLLLSFPLSHVSTGAAMLVGAGCALVGMFVVLLIDEATQP